MFFMFQNANAFNQDISKWDVSSVKFIAGMFKGATLFNQDIGEWNVSSATNMSYMFKDAYAFNQDLGDWNISAVALLEMIFYNIALSVSQYGDMLYAWAQQDVRPDLTLDGGKSQYCDKGQEAKNILEAKGWTFQDNGKNCSYSFTSPNRFDIDGYQKHVGKITLYSSYGDDYTLSINGGADKDLFELDAQGNLQFIHAPDHDHPADRNHDNIYRVQIEAYDASDDRRDIQTVRVHVGKNTTIVPVILYLLN
jgi:surface protein